MAKDSNKDTTSKEAVKESSSKHKKKEREVSTKKTFMSGIDDSVFPEPNNGTDNAVLSKLEELTKKIERIENDGMGKERRMDPDQHLQWQRNRCRTLSLTNQETNTNTIS